MQTFVFRKIAVYYIKYQTLNYFAFQADT